MLQQVDMLDEEVKVKVGKYVINYIKVGCGAHKVLCLPGAMGNIWTDFKPQVEGFDRENFTLIVWDAPGYGKSRPPEREFLSNYYEQDVDMVVEFMKALNIPKFSLLGWCYGGVTGIFVAAKYPERVHKLVIWGARSTILKREIDFYQNLINAKGWSKKMLVPKLEIYGKETFAWLCLNVVRSIERTYHEKEGKVVPLEILRNLTCPTFIIHGEKDPITDKGNVCFLLKNIPDSRAYFYPEGKHNVHLRFAEDFNRRVRGFLLED